MFSIKCNSPKSNRNAWLHINSVLHDLSARNEPTHLCIASRIRQTLCEQRKSIKDVNKSFIIVMSKFALIFVGNGNAKNLHLAHAPQSTDWTLINDLNFYFFLLFCLCFWYKFAPPRCVLHWIESNPRIIMCICGVSIIQLTLDDWFRKFSKVIVCITHSIWI